MWREQKKIVTYTCVPKSIRMKAEGGLCFFFGRGRRKGERLQIIFIGGTSKWSISGVASKGGIRKEGGFPTGTHLVKKGDALSVSSLGMSWKTSCP